MNSVLIAQGPSCEENDQWFLARKGDMVPPRASDGFHAGLTPERVIDVACELTRESYLQKWSVRHLAERLEVAPSMLYHHVGNREAIERAVVERVLGALELPAFREPWQDWARDFFFDLKPSLREYPGVARWLLSHGPVISATRSFTAQAVAGLARVGFGDRAGLVLATLFNIALPTITLADDRVARGSADGDDHRRMLEELGTAENAPEGLALFMGTMIEPFAQAGDEHARASDAYYRFVIETTLLGLEAQRIRE